MQAGVAKKPEVDPLAWKSLIAAIVGYAMDGFDLLILGFMLQPISADLKLDRLQAAALVTWTLMGAVIGGFLFGLLSDRYGRVRVLSWSILIFALFTGLCAFAGSYQELLFYRTIAGLGLGGEFGLGMALVAESWPAAKRGRACSYVALGWQAGVLLAAFLTPLLLPLIGWRGMFLVGVIPSLVAFIVRHGVDEPPIFHSRPQMAQMLAPLKLLIASRDAMRASLAMLVLCSVQNFGYYGLMIWLPSYLSDALGFSLTKSALWTAATIAGMALGIFAFGELSDRYGRRPALLTFQSGAFLSVLIYSQLTDPVALLIGGAVMGVFVNGMLGGYGALLSELYPTQARATAENVLFNLGRGVGGFGPMVIGALAGAFSFAHAIAFLAAIYLLDICATLFLIPETKGQSLD